MELLDVEVKTLRSYTLPFEETLIIPLGDIQYGVAQCDVERLKRHVAWGAARENAYFVGLGDYLDLASPSNRQRITNANLYDTPLNALDTQAQKQLEELQEILAPTKGRWLGLVSGHHFWKFQDGTTTDNRLSNFLGCPWLDACGIIQVRFTPPTNHVKTPSFRMFLHHGKGSGQMQAAPLNLLERFAGSWEGVDVFLMGHQHKKVAAKLRRLYPEFGAHARLRHRNLIIGCTGSFLQSYEGGGGGYAERGMLGALAMGGLVIWARPRLIEGYTDVDLDVSL